MDKDGERKWREEGRGGGVLENNLFALKISTYPGC